MPDISVDLSDTPGGPVAYERLTADEMVILDNFV